MKITLKKNACRKFEEEKNVDDKLHSIRQRCGQRNSVRAFPFKRSIIQIVNFIPFKCRKCAKANIFGDENPVDAELGLTGMGGKSQHFLITSQRHCFPFAMCKRASQPASEAMTIFQSDWKHEKKTRKFLQIDYVHSSNIVIIPSFAVIVATDVWCESASAAAAVTFQCGKCVNLKSSFNRRCSNRMRWKLSHLAAQLSSSSS